MLLGQGILEAARIPPIRHLAQDEVGVGGEGLRRGRGEGEGRRRASWPTELDALRLLRALLPFATVLHVKHTRLC